MVTLHGNNLTYCSVTHVHDPRRAPQADHLEFELYLYPGHDHFFHDQKHWIDMLTRIGNFCDARISNYI